MIDSYAQNHDKPLFNFIYTILKYFSEYKLKSLNIVDMVNRFSLFLQSIVKPIIVACLTTTSNF